MKNNKLKKLVAIVLLGSLSSCDFLDIAPLDSYTEDNIFSDAALTEAYVKKNYVLPRTGWGQAALRFVSDESMNNFSWQDSWTINNGGMTPDNMGGLSTWNDYYWNIKNCNIFFSNEEKLNLIPEETRNILIGEMTFFRAYYYLDLVNKFGGVPLITRTFALDDPEMMVKRNTYEECVDFIQKEFQKAADLLPKQWSGDDFGRVTKGAALAMKARILLYAASPLWNTSDDKQKWQDASDAAQAVMALGYTLDPDYGGLFLNMYSPEIIFHRLYDKEHGHWFDGENSPNGYGKGGYSATCVLQDMVDSYEMEDGTMPNPNIYAAATSDPWKGRDPRLYASVVLDGYQFRDRPAGFYLSETKDKDGNIQIVSGGKDSKFGEGWWNTTKTGYTLRKFMDESLNVWYDRGSQPWIYCRLGEIYLNYAEAQYHLEHEDVAREYVNYIRKRARGNRADILPDITESGEALLKRIQHERKIELAFEEHRFFDVRRWKIAEESDNVPGRAIEIIKKLDGTKSYNIFTIQPDRKFIAPNHYLLPIPQYERQKNPDLEQNPGYSKQ
ncbi:RagB/SusD family nutrient uptake outer membrane protein [Bacteroides sp.]|uniref:RagB/SusD family nutrient uptake outer membrane protein n=1 Tax=Bacteroides sp. TaxID=29523 RepID=UPI00260345E9|nr:RagB/SusD family nutrient uptake outer membrane protein [Bacteroides sp.]